MSLDSREQGFTLARGKTLGVINTSKILKERKTRRGGDAGRGRRKEGETLARGVGGHAEAQRWRTRADGNVAHRG